MDRRSPSSAALAAAPGVKAVVLADTHIRRGSRRQLSARAYAHLESADVVLHAGDVLIQELLDELAGFAPVLAVLGNNDAELVGALPEDRLAVLAGVPVAMVHDSGPRPGRAGRLRRQFPGADVAVFGHSHAPLIEPGLGGQLLVNPGSPTERRAQPHHTLATLELREGAVADCQLHVV